MPLSLLLFGVHKRCVPSGLLREVGGGLLEAEGLPGSAVYLGFPEGGWFGERWGAKRKIRAAVVRSKMATRTVRAR